MQFPEIQKRLMSSMGHGSISILWYLALGLVASIAANLIAFFVTAAGHVDKAVLGPLRPPLSLVLAFLFFCVGAGFYNRRRLSEHVRPYLPHAQSGLHIVSILVALPAFLEILRIFLFMFLDYWPTDFPSYFYAGVALARDQNPYDAELLTELAGRKVFPYLYPPFLAGCLRFVSAVPLEVAVSLWQCCNVLALFGSIYFSLRLAAPSSDSAKAAAIIAGVITPLGLPFYITAQHGSSSMIVAFLLILFFERLHSKKDTAAGIALALAAVIKALPVVFIAYLVVKGRGKALLWTLLSGSALLACSLLVAGWDHHIHFLTDVTVNVGYAVKSDLGFDASFHPANQSINGFFGVYLGATDTPLKAIISSISVLLLLPVLWLLLKRRTNVSQDAVLLTLLMLLLSPITWIHHMVIVIAAATIFAARLVEGAWRLRFWPIVPLAFAVILANDLGRPIMPITFFPLLSHSRLFALLALYSYALVCVINSPAATEEHLLPLR